jgi:REP element-mobilizing transposase RayT
MPRVARIAPGGVIFHVVNRGNARRQVFEHDGDYEALERVIVETAERIAIRDGELGRFVQRLTTTHVLRLVTFIPW